MDLTLAIGFLAVGTTVWGLFHLYLGWRLLGPARWPRWARTIVWTLAGLSTVLWPGVFVARFGGLLGPWVRALSWAAYLAMGFVATLMLLMLARDLGWLAWVFGGGRVGAVGGARAPDARDLERRRVVLATTGAAAAVAAGGLSVAGFAQVARGARVRTVPVPVADLPREFEGYRIAHLTDIHVSELITERDTRTAVEMVDELDADAVVVTGDLSDGYPEELARDIAPLADLRSRDGVFFVTGNHEYYWDIPGWADAVRGLGWITLHNEHRRIHRGTASLAMAGVPDPDGENFDPGHVVDPAAAIRGAPDDAVRVLLAHRPRQIHEAAEAGYHLQLSGHTHGGQFWPFKPMVRLAEPYVSGLHLHRDTWIFVSNGYGFWGPPHRAGIPAEVALVSLHRA